MTKPAMNANGTSASVHLVRRGKGGVGKSFVSALKLVGTVVIRGSVSKVPEDHTAVVCTSAASSTSGFVTVVLVPRSSFPNGTDAANDDARPPVDRLLAEKSYMPQIVFMTSPTAVLMKSGKDQGRLKEKMRVRLHPSADRRCLPA